MKVNTLRFGELEVPEDQLFTFPMGILGFANLKSFIIIEREESRPFKWLQSVDDPSTAFVIGDPLLFYPSYRAEVRRAELSSIHPIEDEKDLALSVIMTITPDPQNISSNMLAPIIINLANRRGMQYVLNDKRYPVRYHLFKEADIITPPVSGDQSELRSLSLR
jgi:flagellar assembly factor FliW